MASVVASAGAFLGLEERLLGMLFGDVLARNHRLEPPSGCSRPVRFDRHVRSPPSPALSRRPSVLRTLSSNSTENRRTCPAGAPCLRRCTSGHAPLSL